MFDPLPGELAAALHAASGRVGRFGQLRYLADTTSTNDQALALTQAGAAEGTSVLADLQRAGRGRRGHDWFSPPEAGLYLSTIVRPQAGAGTLSLVTLAAGVAVARAIGEVASLPVELKWPNDIVIGRPWRKLGGVLCEGLGANSQVDAVVIGIGLNLLHTAYPREIAGRATSIEVELGRTIERTPLVVTILASLREIVDRLHAQEFEGIAREWRRFARAGLHGAGVRWREHERERRGIARDIDHDGALLVDAEGRVERIIAGDVTWDALQ